MALYEKCEEEEESPLSVHSWLCEGKRNICLLSTHKVIYGVTKDDGIMKPQVYKLNDYTEEGRLKDKYSGIRFNRFLKGPEYLTG